MAMTRDCKSLGFGLRRFESYFQHHITCAVETVGIMSKKLNLDETAKAVEDLSKKVDVITRNRLVIAIFLIVDGITFLLNPDTTLGGMAQNIILIMLLATLSVFLTSLASKTKDIKTIVISLIVLVVGAFFYFYPDIIAAYIQLLLSLFIIYDGMVNLSNVLNLNILSRFTKFVARKFEGKPKKKSKYAKFKEVDDNIDKGLEEQAEKLMNPLKNIVGKTNKSSILFIIANIASITLGVVLLVFPGASMMIWGIIFLYTGLTNLSIAARTTHLLQKIKERRFKEILFEESDKKKTKKDSEKEKTKKSKKTK